MRAGSALVVWLVAALGAATFAIVFYPGAMPFDAAYQWWQARGGTTSNIHGVGMVWLWRAVRLAIDGPGGMFALQLAVLWIGLALVARELDARPAWRAAVMIVAGFAPVCAVVMAHVWSDALLMAVLTLAVGAMVAFRRTHARSLIIASVALLFIALTLRHNALPAIVPLVVYAVYLWNGSRPLSKRRLVAVAFCLTTFLQVSAWAIEYTVDDRRTLFAATALWDLASISLQTHSMLLPPETHAPALTPDDLAQAFDEFSNASLFARTHAGMRQPFFRPDDPLNASVRSAWVSAIAANPGAYWDHRWRVTSGLFGTRPRAWPAELVYFNGEFQFDGNPPVAPNASVAHDWAIGLFERWRDGILLTAWPYLLIALVALAATLRRGDSDLLPARAVLLSGLLYAAPLPIIAPSAELRYLGWTCLSALLGAALTFAAPRVVPARRSDEITSVAYPPAP